MRDPLRLFVIGPGRAGLGLARAAGAAGVEVVGLLGRRPVDARPPLGPVWARGAAGEFPPALRDASVVFVAVQDRALDEVLVTLVDAPLAPGAVVLQASGSVEPAAFTALRAAGRACGTLHPLVPLAAPERAPALLHGAWVGVDGDAAAVRVAEALAARLGAYVLHIPAGGRARYHAAAVFASNFPVTLAAVAERLLVEAGVDAAAARPAVRQLLAGAAANLAGGGDAVRALTGPVARGDAGTVAAHLRALGEDPSAGALYRALAAATVGVVRRAAAAGVPGPDPTALAAVEALLAAPSGPTRGGA